MAGSNTKKWDRPADRSNRAPSMSTFTEAVDRPPSIGERVIKALPHLASDVLHEASVKSIPLKKRAWLACPDCGNVSNSPQARDADGRCRGRKACEDRRMRGL